MFRLSELDGTLLELPKLEHLYLQGNSIVSIKSLSLPSLVRINLNSNRIGTLEQSGILNSKFLTLFDISSNPVSQLPQQTFTTLKGLKSVNFGNTKLETIPKIPQNIRLNEFNLDNIPIKW